MASQVKLALNEREMKQLFLKTLPPEYFQGLVFSGCQTFSQLVDVGEGVEWAFIEGKISIGGAKKFQARKDKEAAVEVALVQESFYPRPPTAPTHKPMAVQESSSRAYDKGKRPFRKEFSPLLQPLSKLLPMLLEKRMVAKEVPRDNLTRFAGFDVTKTCEYHMGERGHDVDSCNVLRYKVQQLLDKNILTFKEAQLNVQQNPLPDHAEGVNSISEEMQASQQPLVVNASKLYESLVLAGYYGGHQDVTPEEKLNCICKMVAMGVIRRGEEEEDVVSMIMPSSFRSSFCNIARISRAKKIMPRISKTPALYEEWVIAMITSMVIELSDEETAGNIEMEIAEPTVIDLMVEEMSAIKITRGNVTPVTIELPSQEEDGVIVLESPPKFDPKAVPWDYQTNEVDAVTRSGRCYAPDKGIEKKVVTEEEVKQFLAVVKSSEFNVVDQLRKLSAQISLLELFKSSEKHRDILLKVLNKVHVPETIDEVQLEEFVGAVLLKDQISFTDEDLPPDGPNHTKALHISVKHESTLVCIVLIDNGSTLNICPLATLHRLGIDLRRIRTGKSTVPAFDGMKKDVIWEIELELLIGPILFQVVFQVLDIPIAFNFLLGRPWIHMAGDVASSLHQKVRFVVDNRLITVHGESDFKIYHKTTIPYVELEGTEESNFQTFELVSMVHVPAGSFTKVPELSKPAIAAGKIILASGYNPGEGLGSHGQGVQKLIEAHKNFKRRGLGYVEKWGGHNNRGGRGRHGGWGARGGWDGYRDQSERVAQTEEDKGYQSLFSPLLEETFPGPPRMLFEEEEDIYGVTELFEECVICTIMACEEVKSSEVVAVPPE
ncbi:uncharacterized protein LOC104451747 [Eucalyptus grandis]|uniref:uncharacterized protein LOC104451747 n=1 Tax=Eucalyptus grandis TaxID=71139 RepID=UPI00192E8A10|nr:uncharacterized protein LOC104451747 [Eucalyptus grandis]